jgi:hypothetical protein
MKLRSVPYDRKFTIPGRTGQYAYAVMDTKSTDGITHVRVASIVNGVVDVSGAFWIDWETDVQILPRQVISDFPEEK